MLVARLIIAGVALSTFLLGAAPAWAREPIEGSVKDFLNKHCIECHGEGEEINGDVDFTKMNTPEEIDANFEVWKKAIELVSDGSMPPEDQPRPGENEIALLKEWYQERFVRSVEAHPGFFRPRRLSAYEYRNTLRSVFGFELEVAVREAEQTVAEKSMVMKLLPTDPPGASGFTNDTSGNPLTTLIWDQYSYLIDNALEKLFSPRYRDALTGFTGQIENDQITNTQAERMLRTFARRAFRRKLDETWLVKHLSEIEGKSGGELERALRTKLKTILMSPQFMYRGLLLDVPVDTNTPVDDFELAERLSYFLWADMPDEELMRLASDGRLVDDANYREQIERMLRSPKARSLAIDLGGQWFSLNEIDKVSKNVPVAGALKSQPFDFLNYLFTEGRPLVELIDSDVTFINPHTAGTTRVTVVK